MADISDTVAPNSKQITADDLRSGPWTITVTKVSVDKAAEQPVTIFYQDCGDKPFKPCKTMRRVLLELWGNNSIEYAGKSLTVYRDDAVSFGKDKVGGVRISHMSHIGSAPKRVSVITTKGRRGAVVVKPLVLPVESQEYAADRAPAQETAPPAKPRITPTQWADARVAAINSCQTIEDLQSLTGAPQHVNAMGRQKETAPDEHTKVANAASAKAETLMSAEPDFDTETGELAGEPA